VPSDVYGAWAGPLVDDVLKCFGCAKIVRAVVTSIPGSRSKSSVGDVPSGERPEVVSSRCSKPAQPGSEQPNADFETRARPRPPPMFHCASTAHVSGHQPASGLNSPPAYDALARPHRCQSCSALVASLTARLLSCLPLAGAHSQSTILANLTRPLTLVEQRCRSCFPRRWRLYVGGVVFRVAQIAGHDGSERLTRWQGCHAEATLMRFLYFLE
jgi:hypothetical protein